MMLPDDVLFNVHLKAANLLSSQPAASATGEWGDTAVKVRLSHVFTVPPAHLPPRQTPFTILKKGAVYSAEITAQHAHIKVDLPTSVICTVPLACVEIL